MSQRVEVGRHAYIIRGNEGHSEYLLISAHGSTGKRSFVVPAWTRLHFYAPSGSFLVMDMSKFNLSAVVSEEVNSGNYSNNYLLSKFQGRNGGDGETYDTLGTAVDVARNAIDAAPREPLVLPQNIGPNLRRDLLKQDKEKYENLLPFDILTIRNRSLFKGGSLIGLPLSEVLTAVAEIHRYPYIFCSFCRGNIFQGISDFVFDKTGGRLGTNHTHNVQIMTSGRE